MISKDIEDKIKSYLQNPKKFLESSPVNVIKVLSYGDGKISILDNDQIEISGPLEEVSLVLVEQILNLIKMFQKTKIKTSILFNSIRISNENNNLSMEWIKQEVPEYWEKLKTTTMRIYNNKILL